MDMETDGPLLDDVNMLKKAMTEEATQVRNEVSVYSVAVNITAFLGSNIALQSNHCGPISYLYILVFFFVFSGCMLQWNP